MVVVWELKSSTHMKLVRVALTNNPKRYLVQNRNELYISIVSKEMKKGITAGASTPEVIIKKIENKIRGNFNV